MQDLKIKIKEFVSDELKRRASRMGVSVGKINDEDNLLGSGLIDSMGFIELIASVEKSFNVEFSVDLQKPSEFTTLSGFVNCMVEK